MMTRTGRCMNARPRYAPARVANEGWFQPRRDRRLRTSEGIERSGALRESEIDHDEHDRDDRKRGGEGNVARRTLLRVDHHADEVAGRADDARNDVVAERQ